MKHTFTTALSAYALALGLADAQSCSTTLTASYPAPTVAKGLVARLVANGLTAPRGIQFDNKGALLVVEQGKGISALSFVDSGNNCVSLASKKAVVNNTGLNHGIQLSQDGATLYASTGSEAYGWQYDSANQATTSSPQTLVAGMAGSDHTTRTLLLSNFAPGLMVINHGSNSNLDVQATNISSGQSQVKAFNITGITKPYNFNTDGKLLGWGLRNDVGIGEHPITGGIFTVENSADQITRDGQDVHLNNPAEEMNFLGYLNGTKSPNQGRNFGYPTCFTAWNASELPNFKGTTGDAFQIGNTPNDTLCSASLHQLPRLAFQAHMAPLDIIFNKAGTMAFISFHGSWDRYPPVGYQVAVVQFAKGQPVAPRTSTTAAIPIMANVDLTKCPKSCFHPVGLTWDSKGRLFMSSDITGEIYMIARTDGKSIDTVGVSNVNATGSQSDAESGSSSSGVSSSSSDSAATTTTSTSSGSRIADGVVSSWMVGLLSVVVWMLTLGF